MNRSISVEHVFRHNYGKLVALLLRRFDINHLDAIEDAVQWAMTQAVELWSRSEPPDDPTSWLYKVAYRHLLSELRSTKRKENLLASHYVGVDNIQAENIEPPLSGEMGDSLLRMLFVACNVAIPIESQLVFTLKSLCGFNIREISIRLFLTEANVYKRFSRARNYLQKQTLKLDTLTVAEMEIRLPSIHRVLYLVFTEGYLSSHIDLAIRRDLCEEAIRLMNLLSGSQIGGTPESYALLALMYFHFSRIDSRQDDYGALLLFEQQDRSRWNKKYITLGLAYLDRSTESETISRYHIEAGIAAEHCLSPSFERTRWEKIAASYELLEQIAPSPLNLLNRAIVTAEWKSPQEGLAVLLSTNIPSWLDCSYHWFSVLSDLQYRCGEITLATEYAKRAIEAAPTVHIKKLLQNRLIKRVP